MKKELRFIQKLKFLQTLILLIISKLMGKPLAEPLAENKTLQTVFLLNIQNTANANSLCRFVEKSKTFYNHAKEIILIISYLSSKAFA